jgi:uncharacterized protein YrrD
MPVDSIEGPWGEVDDIVIDPRNWHVTHVVVQPHGHHERSRLVPVGAITSSDERLVLSWTAAEIDRAAAVEVTDFVRVDRSPRNESGWHIDASGANSWPYFPAGRLGPVYAGTFGYGSSHSYETGAPKVVATTFDRVPSHTVEIRRSSDVVSSDDHVVGTVDGFVFDQDGAITHLVLDHGHLWGHRDITIPMEHVRSATSERVHLDASRQAIGEFPSVPFHRPARVG